MVKLEEWDYICLQCVGSTNDEVKKYCSAPCRKVAVRAEKQTSGRGRRGRNWISEEGNLFCSLAFEFELKNLGALVMITALSLAQAAESFSAAVKPQLKWPNDVLLNGAKLSGILLEKGEGDYIIVGVGVNIVSAPENENLLYKATSLYENGIICTAEEFLARYLQKFNRNLLLLDRNKKALLKDEWLKRARGIGQPVVVRCDDREEKGVFCGIDDDMALLLKQKEKIIKVLVGDVFFENGEKNERI